MSDFPTLPEHVKSTYFAYGNLMRSLNSISRRYDLNSTAVTIVAFLGDQEMSVAQMSDLMAVASNLSYNVALLEKQGILGVRINIKDRRSRLIRLTPIGRKLCVTIRKELARERTRIAA